MFVEFVLVSCGYWPFLDLFRTISNMVSFGSDCWLEKAESSVMLVKFAHYWNIFTQTTQGTHKSTTTLQLIRDIKLGACKI